MRWDGDEDCTEMWQNGATWNDFDCEATKAFVCGFCNQVDGQGVRADFGTLVTQTSVRGPFRTACVGNSDPRLALDATVTEFSMAGRLETSCQRLDRNKRRGRRRLVALWLRAASSCT